MSEVSAIPSDTEWRPGTEPQALRARAEMLSIIRDFFSEHRVMEVATPALGAAGVTDAHIDNLHLRYGGRDYFLQSSPEYYMKRLLAAGAGPVYQICPAFRGGELGPLHNIEFSMLEWYRPGFPLQDLMAEVEALVCRLARYFDLPLPTFLHARYKDLFRGRYGCDPHKLTEDTLIRLVADDRQLEPAHLDDDSEATDYLEFLFSAGIEASLQDPVFIGEFPATQALLATTSEDQQGCLVADRFELYIRGMELANGYAELTDRNTLQARFEANNRQRRRRGLPMVPMDNQLLAAMPAMPETAGVAVGLDRLLMLLTGSTRLDEVMPFVEARL